MNRIIACIQRKGTSRDIQSGFDARFFGAVSGRFQSLTAVGVGKSVVPHAVALPCADIKGTAVDVERGVRLYAVTVYVDIECTAVDGDGACRFCVDHGAFCLIRRVGSTLDAVVRGFDDVCALIDDDTAVTGDAVIDRRAGGGSAVILRVAAYIDLTAPVKDQLCCRAALDAVLGVGDDIQITITAEGHCRAALDLDCRALKGFGYGRIG